MRRELPVDLARSPATRSGGEASCQKKRSVLDTAIAILALSGIIIAVAVACLILSGAVFL